MEILESLTSASLYAIISHVTMLFKYLLCLLTVCFASLPPLSSALFSAAKNSSDKASAHYLAQTKQLSTVSDYLATTVEQLATGGSDDSLSRG